METLPTMRAFPQYQDDAEFIRGVNAAWTASGEDADRVISSTAIVLLHPLCLTTGRVPTAVEWFKDNDFTVWYSQQIQLVDEHLQLVWKYQIAAHDPQRIRIMSELMTHGPSMLIAVTDEQADSKSAATRLRALKGPADPHRADPQHLRSRLGAANMFNNLAHTPDGPGEVLRESAALLRGSRLAHLWQQATAALRRSHPVHAPRLPEPPLAGPPGGISLTHVAVRLRQSLLAELRLLLPTAASLLASLELKVADEAAWVSTKDPAKPVKTLTEFRRLFQSISVPLEDAAQSANRDRPRALAAAFTETDRALFGSGFNAGRLKESAADGGLPLALHERLIFDTEWLSLQYRRLAQTAGNDISLRPAHRANPERQT